MVAIVRSTDQEGLDVVYSILRPIITQFEDRQLRTRAIQSRTPRLALTWCIN